MYAFIALLSFSWIYLAGAIELCDGAGYDLGNVAYWFMRDSELATETKCGDHCRADPLCMSFAVGKGACMHYDSRVAGNTRSDIGSPWKFFDRSCVIKTTTSNIVVTSTDLAYVSTPTTPSANEASVTALAQSSSSSASMSTPSTSVTFVSSVGAVAQTSGGAEASSSSTTHATGTTPVSPTGVSPSVSSSTTPNSGTQALPIGAKSVALIALTLAALHFH